MRTLLVLVVLGSVAFAGGAEKEKLGAVGPGTTADAAIKALGKPTKQDEVKVEPATGEYVSDWTFRDGVTATMTGAKEKGPFAVRSMEITAPSKLKTKKGVGLGSTLAAVKKAYGKDLVHDGEVWRIGDAYFSLSFTFENDKVKSVFLGVGAE
jgi:hypothetical protein